MRPSFLLGQFEGDCVSASKHRYQEVITLSAREDLLRAIERMDETGVLELLSHARALEAEPVILTSEEERELSEAEEEVARGEVVPWNAIRRTRVGD